MGHTDRWHEERRHGIGGSDIAAIAGLSRYASAMTVYLEKIGAGEDVEQNDAMEWGTRLEETVAAKFADDHPEFKVLRKVDTDGDEFTFWHADHPWAYAHVDRQLVANDKTGETPYEAAWECKTSGREGRKYNWTDEAGNDMVPDSVMAQVQWEIACLNVERAYLSVLFEGRTYREFIIERDDEMITLLFTIGEEFWRHVETRTPPAIDSSDATKEVLAILYRETIDEELELPAETAELVARRIEAKEAIAQTERILQGIDNQLKALLGEHETGRAGDYFVSWKPQTRSGGIDAKSLAEHYPDVADQFKKPDTTFRVLRIVEPRED